MNRIEKISAITDHKEVHKEVLKRCAALLNTVKFTRPVSESNFDRIMRVELRPDMQYLARGLNNEYKKWVRKFILKHSNILSKIDINLLWANQAEISSYILMKRKGLDVTKQMYGQLFRKELRELLYQQVFICNGVILCKERNIFKKRYWQDVPLTIGIEEEYQIVSKINGDGKAWDLKQDVDRILEKQKGRFASNFGREVYKSQIEAKTDVCSNVSDLRNNLLHTRQELFNDLPSDLAIISAGTHPFSIWNAQIASNSARTKMFMHDMQDIVRRLVTFGLHVHVGVEDKELAVQIMNEARGYIPLMLALSANSPFWEGRMTGLMSYRSTVFSSLPRTGIPPQFSNYHELAEYYDLMHRTKSFDSAGANDPRKIWWDIRVHPNYPTIEFRIFDACCYLEDTISMAAMCQAIVAKIAKHIHYGKGIHSYKKHIIEENKWRAIRYGRRASFIEDHLKQNVSAEYKCLELLEFVHDVIPALGSRREMEHLLKIVKRGTGADAQLKIFQRHKNLPAVVQWLAQQFISEKN
jgi:glutamate---cysteine ligase / carboxylate-amine ligase